MKYKNICGAILAGGKNTRMNGQNKAYLQINDTTFLDMAIEKLDGLFSDVMIIADRKDKYTGYNDKNVILEDEFNEIGPLGGIYTGLAGTGCEAVFFTPCDMPFLDSDLIRQIVEMFMAGKSDGVVPGIKENIEPLVSVYRRGLKDKIRMYIETNSDRSVRKFLRTVNIRYLELEDNGFNRKKLTNINSLEEYDRSVK